MIWILEVLGIWTLFAGSFYLIGILKKMQYNKFKASFICKRDVSVIDYAIYGANSIFPVIYYAPVVKIDRDILKYKYNNVFEIPTCISKEYNKLFFLPKNKKKLRDKLITTRPTTITIFYNPDKKKHFILNIDEEKGSYSLFLTLGKVFLIMGVVIEGLQIITYLINKLIERI